MKYYNLNNDFEYWVAIDYIDVISNERIEFRDYAVSNLGRIKNLKTNQIISQHDTHNGYKKVMLWRNSKPKNLRVSRIMSHIFLMSLYDEDKVFIDHIDRDRKNNDLKNLRFVTRKENNNNRKERGI